MLRQPAPLNWGVRFYTEKYDNIRIYQTPIIDNQLVISAAPAE